MSVDLASLVVEVNASGATEAQAALTGLATTGGQAETAMTGLGTASEATAAKTRTASQAASDMAASAQAAAAGVSSYAQGANVASAAAAKLAAEEDLARREIAASTAALEHGIITLDQYNREIAQTKAALASARGEFDRTTRSMQASDAAQDSLNRNSRSTGSALRGVGGEAQQLATALASGVDPMTALSNQGTQLAAAMVFSGASVGALTTQLGQATAAFAAANPLIILAAAAAGVLVAALALVTEEINETSDVTVTMGDVMLGTFDVLQVAVTSRLQPVFEALGTTVGAVWEAMKQSARNSINFMISAILVVPNVVAAAFVRIPAAIGDAFFTGVNNAITALNLLIRAQAAPLNALVRVFNAVFNRDIPEILANAIPSIGNAFAGGLANLGTGMGAAFSRSFQDHVGDIADAVGDASVARARLRQGAKDMGDDAGAAAGRALGRSLGNAAANEAEEALEPLSNTLDLALRAFRDYLRAVDAAEADTSRMDAANEALRIEAQTLEMVGWQRARLILQMEREAALRPVLEQLSAAEVAGQSELAEQYQRQIDLLTERYGLQIQMGDRTDALQQMQDQLDGVAASAASLGSILSDAFGNVGSVIGEALSSLTDYAAEQERITRSGASAAAQERQLGALRARNTATMLGGLKSLFKEHSVGYKVMGAIEKAHAAFQLFNMVKSMVMDATATASSVANSAVRGTASGAAGAAKIFEQMGAFAFPVVAAMVAVLAALGVKIAGGGGGGGVVAPPSAEDNQAGIGTGTVLGDGSAQSSSIANALGIMVENSNTDLEYSNEAVQHLRAIEAGIGGLTAALARSLNVSGGSFDTSKFNIGTSGSSGVLGLFASSTTRTVYDQGLDVFQTTVADVLMKGVDAQVYNVIQQVKKKSGFFGIGGGTKTSYQTVTGSAPGGIEDQFALIIREVSDGIIAFGTQLGLDVTSYLATAVIPEARLSFLGMSGEEIQDALEAYFSSVADAITEGAFAASGFDLTAFQKAGEGLFETLARVTRTMSTVSTSLNSINMGDALAGLSLTDRASGSEQLATLFGGLDGFQDAVADFGDKFLSEAERMQPIIAAVSAEMERLGASGVTTNAQFKGLVQGLDLGTEAGREMFAQLLAVAPAFALVNEYLAKTAQVATETGQTLAQLAAIAKERRGLEIALLEATGQAEAALAAKREDVLAGLDASNRALQLQIFAAQDATAAQRELELATAAAARVTEDAAREATRIAEEAARAQLAIANKRRSLEIELLEATGDAAGALAARRADELAALDETLRPLQEMVWAARDAGEAVTEVVSSFDLLRAATALNIRLLEAQGNSEAALAIRREEEMAATDERLRGLLGEVFAAEDAAKAADALADAQAAAARVAADAAELVTRAAEEAAEAAQRIAEERAGLERQILELVGDTTAIRALELAALDASNRSLLEQIFALEDATAAAAALTQAQAEAAQVAADAAAEAVRLAQELADKIAAVASERAGLEIRYLEAIGDASGALALRRAAELAATDESNRALLQMIFAAEDAAAAVGGVSNALDTLAERTNLTIRLLQEQGNTEAALAMQREQEMAGTAEANRDLLAQIYAQEDANAAAARAAERAAEAQRLAEERQREATQAAEELARAAEEAARAQRELADATTDMRIRLLQAQGDDAAALALQREKELASTDASLHAMLRQIYALEDAKTAQDAYNEALAASTQLVDDARSDLTAAYEREAGALRETITTFSDFGTSLREFRDGLFATGASAAAGYRQLQVKFLTTAALAATGDVGGLGSIQGAGEAFLSASRDQATSLAQYQRDVAFVARSVDTAIGAADDAVDYAELQLAALDQSVAGLIEINESVLSVADAITALHDAMYGAGTVSLPAPVIAPAVASGGLVTGDAVTQSNADLRGEVSALRADLQAALSAIANNTRKTSDVLTRADGGDFIRIGNDEDTPVYSEVVA